QSLALILDSFVPARAVQAYHTTIPISRPAHAYQTTVTRATSPPGALPPARAVQAYQTALPARHHHQIG
ncbi:MAG: hypothetical protein ACK5GU_08790, partial [Chloroflexota bacterium]